MAEILIKASDTTNPDPVKDLRGCYKNSYAVVVKPDGWKWGKEELDKKKFYILSIPDKTVEELEFLTKPDEINIGQMHVAEAPEIGVMAHSHDSESAAVSACESIATAVVAALKDYGLDVSYNIKTRVEEVRHPIARRKFKLDIEQIENDLKSGVVETTSDKISVIEISSGETVTLANKISETSK